MPALSTLQLIPPCDEKEFEQMTLDYFCYLYGMSELYGRRGQKQNGVDIITLTTEEIIGVQCKNYQNTLIDQNSIDQIVELAETFEPSISSLYIVTTALKDSKLQKYIYELCKERREKNKFGVFLIYWDEISNFIKNHEELLKKYYPNIYLPNQEMIYTISTIKELKDKFMNLILKYQIHDFIKADPFSGLPYDLVVNIDLFILEIQNLLERAFICQPKRTYHYIKEFLGLLNGYMTNLSFVMQYNYSDWFIIPSIIKYDEAHSCEIGVWVDDYKTALDDIFNKIFKGCSIFG